MTFAVVLANFGPEMRPGGTYMKQLQSGDEIASHYEYYPPPTIFRLGTAITLYETLTNRWLVSMQLNHPVDNAENIALGTEIQILKFLFLRGGYKINTDEGKFTFGSGLKMPLLDYTLVMDYSYSDFGLLGDSQRFSLSFWF